MSAAGDWSEYTALDGLGGPTALLVAAHPDDEVAGAGGWAAGWAGALRVAILTDGVPADRRWFAPGYSDAAVYRATRRREAEAAWQILRPDVELIFGGFGDQNLAWQLEPAGRWLAELVQHVRPGWILTPAFEGGHPDHDAANRLVAEYRGRHATWEYALYHSEGGRIVYQQFAGRAPGRLPAAAAARKCAALEAYRSQRLTLIRFDPALESLRRLPAHDYSAPPGSAPAVYEHWGFGCSRAELARQLQRYGPGPTSCAC